MKIKIGYTEQSKCVTANVSVEADTSLGETQEECATLSKKLMADALEYSDMETKLRK